MIADAQRHVTNSVIQHDTPSPLVQDVISEFNAKHLQRILMNPNWSTSCSKKTKLNA